MVVLPRWSRQWSWKSGGEFPTKKLRTVVSLACFSMHDWGDARSPFHDKNSYFLEKDDWYIILSWVKCILSTKYLPAEPIRYPKAKLTLTSISWLAVQSNKMRILHLAFIFCCIRSRMALHVRIKTYFLPVICLTSWFNSRFHGFLWSLFE
jgi:hypothetical protein